MSETQSYKTVTVTFTSKRAEHAAAVALVFYREHLKKALEGDNDDAESVAYWTDRLEATEAAMRDFKVAVSQ